MRGDPDHHKFLIGTNSLRDDNEVHFVQFYEDRGDISCERIFPHPSEIWQMSSCPTKEDTFFTVYNQGTIVLVMVYFVSSFIFDVGGQFRASLWQAKGLEDSIVTSLTLPLTQLSELPDHEGQIRWCVVL